MVVNGKGKDGLVAAVVANAFSFTSFPLSFKKRALCSLGVVVAWRDFTQTADKGPLIKPTSGA
jgi:hypothetical protein